MPCLSYEFFDHIQALNYNSRQPVIPKKFHVVKTRTQALKLMIEEISATQLHHADINYCLPT